MRLHLHLLSRVLLPRDLCEVLLGTEHDAQCQSRLAPTLVGAAIKDLPELVIRHWQPALNISWQR